MILLLSSLAREAIPFPENTRSPTFLLSGQLTHLRSGALTMRRLPDRVDPGRDGLWGEEKAPDWPRLGNLLTKLRRAAVAGLRRLVVVVVLVGESRDLYLESRGCCEANAPTRIREYHEQICPAASEENSYFTRTLFCLSTCPSFSTTDFFK